MDYDYMSFHREKDVHNKCYGGRLWCIKVCMIILLSNLNIFLLLYNLNIFYLFFFIIGYMWNYMCNFNMAINNLCRVCSNGSYSYSHNKYLIL